MIEWHGIKHWLKCMWMYGVYLTKNDDYDWDFVYLYKHMRWKIERMHKNITKRDIVESVNRQSRQMKYAMFLLDKLIEGEITTEWEKVREKWGRLMFVCTGDPLPENVYVPPLPKLPESFKGRGLRTMVSTYANAKTKEEYEQAKKDYSLAMEKDRQEYEDIKRRFFKHLETYIERWWD